MAGAADGSVGLRDHMANSFLEFSRDEAADCFGTSGEVRMGDARSDDGVEGTSGDWETGAGTDIGSDISSDVGSDARSGACSETSSATGLGAGPNAGSGTGSEVGSRTGSDICRTS